jgi:hypothetical protein
MFLFRMPGGESKKIVEQLDISLQDQELTLIRDKKDHGFKDLISHFIKKLGQIKQC